MAFVIPIAVFFSLLHRIENYDFLWHLFLGRYIVESRVVPDLNIFYYSPAAHFGYNFSWLSQVIFFGLYSTFGPYAVVLLNASVGAVVFYFLHRILTRSNSNILTNLVFLLLLYYAIVPYLDFRPVIFSLLFMSVFLWLLDTYSKTGQHARIIPLPLIMITWVNLHPGFPLGLVLIFLFLVAAIKSSRAHPLLICLGFSFIALLVNPYGHEVFLFVYRSVTALSLLRAVGEWKSYTGDKIPAFTILAGLSIVSLVVKRPRTRELLPFLTFFALAAEMVRNIPLFAIASTPVIRELDIGMLVKGRLRSLLSKFNIPDISSSGLVTYAVVVTVLLLMARPAKLVVDMSRYPVNAVQYIAAEKIKGNVFSQDVWSGCLLWYLYPHRKVFFDAKGGFGQQQMQDYYTLMKPGPGWEMVLANNDITLVLLPPDKPLSIILEQADGWTSVIRDSCAVLFQRGKGE